MRRALAAQRNGLPAALDTPEALQSALATEKTSVWIDFVSATPEEVQLLAETFALDPLTIQDSGLDIDNPDRSVLGLFGVITILMVLVLRRGGWM